MKVLKTAAETTSRMALMMGRHLDSTAAWKKKDLKTAFQTVLKMVPMVDCRLE
jgi:hypothetical protein